MLVVSLPLSHNELAIYFALHKSYIKREFEEEEWKLSEPHWLQKHDSGEMLSM